MSVKLVDKLPTQLNNGKKVIWKDQIIADINYAIDHKLTEFEFDGDYNYVHLAEYSKQVFRHYIWWKIIDKIYEDEPYKNFEPGQFTRFKFKFFDTCSEHQADRIHVYAKINYSVLDKIKHLIVSGVNW